MSPSHVLCPWVGTGLQSSGRLSLMGQPLWLCPFHPPAPTLGVHLRPPAASECLFSQTALASLPLWGPPADSLCTPSLPTHICSRAGRPGDCISRAPHMAEMPVCPSGGPHLCKGCLWRSPVLTHRVEMITPLPTPTSRSANLQSSTSLLCLSWFSASGDRTRGQGLLVGLRVTSEIKVIAVLSFISPEGVSGPNFN